ncbi:ATPase, T2SS/T4P/T4SS family [Salinisphaera sp.]|uniref:ATPase, T2SS/T4P/T4SS family n=1 Tax=Salinisphaera sp. TaxID=1914330 RepID=UPI002D7892FE|nr:ATPase, T2SS/T4P/T4SS family [Salinisphaera sp.]HET7314080.1 ATPase, T2SS/T4P/T4SS family [Salinisphaera sp.]
MAFQVRVDTAKGMHVGDYFIAEDSCLVGKNPSNALVLHGWRLDREHARIMREEQGLFVQDLGSRIGTRVNGQKVGRYGPIERDDVIEIHDYRLRLMAKGPRTRVRSARADNEAAQSEPFAVESPAEPDERRAASQTPRAPGPSAEQARKPSLPAAAPSRPAEQGNPSVSAKTDLPGGALDQSASLSEHALLMHHWRAHLRRALHDQMDLRRINVSSMSDDELRTLTTQLVGEVIAKLRDLPDTVDRGLLTEQVVAEAVGLGPLEPLLAREEISEIMVNSARDVFFERSGRMYKSDVTFTDDQTIQATIERIVAPLGRRIDESSPMVDARLKDGSRVNAIIPPLALKGPCLTIRKFMKERLTTEHLIQFGSIDQAMVDFLEVAVRYKRNILISGGTGSGKTTLLNVLSNNIPSNERIVTIEDSAELQLHHPNLVSLEGRPPNQEGRGEVSIRDLVRNALRMRPDRIVVGECRGGEALDMLQAMNTGHDGSLTTAHANSARDCLSRVEVMVLMAGMDLPTTAIREQIASAVNMIVQQTRFPCGSRKITSITEVVGMENGRIQLAEVFRFRQTGYDDDGRVLGHYEPTGLVPEFYEELHQRGVDLDLSLFDPEAATQ